ncbi:hypothetical protein [Salipaludibacillus neizhouensis]
MKADKYGIVSLDNKEYSTSPRFAKQRVKTRLTFNTVVVLKVRQ